MYEFNLSISGVERIKVLGRDESLEQLTRMPKSFIRFGDGEINLMLGKGQPFQEYNKDLVDILYRALEEPERDDLYICLNHEYYSPQIVHDDYLFREYIRRYGYDFRRFLAMYCNKEKTYLDAGMIGFPMLYFQSRKEQAESHFARWKRIFRDRDVVVVAGKGIWDDLSYNIFEEAKTTTIIHGLPRHAWREHDKLMSRIINETSKDHLIVFSLGMAGKAMIYELTSMGYQAWDMGHINKYYNAFKTGFVYSRENRNDFYSPD